MLVRRPFGLPVFYSGFHWDAIVSPSQVQTPRLRERIHPLTLGDSGTGVSDESCVSGYLPAVHREGAGAGGARDLRPAGGRGESLEPPALIAQQLNRVWHADEVLVERYQLTRGRAMSGQRRG